MPDSFRRFAYLLALGVIAVLGPGCPGDESPPSGPEDGNGASETGVDTCCGDVTPRDGRGMDGSTDAETSRDMGTVEDADAAEVADATDGSRTDTPEDAEDAPGDDMGTLTVEAVSGARQQGTPQNPTYTVASGTIFAFEVTRKMGDRTYAPLPDGASVQLQNTFESFVTVKQVGHRFYLKHQNADFSGEYTLPISVSHEGTMREIEMSVELFEAQSLEGNRVRTFPQYLPHSPRYIRFFVTGKPSHLSVGQWTKPYLVVRATGPNDEVYTTPVPPRELASVRVQTEESTDPVEWNANENRVDAVATGTAEVELKADLPAGSASFSVSQRVLDGTFSNIGTITWDGEPTARTWQLRTATQDICRSYYPVARYCNDDNLGCYFELLDWDAVETTHEPADAVDFRPADHEICPSGPDDRVVEETFSHDGRETTRRIGYHGTQNATRVRFGSTPVEFESTGGITSELCATFETEIKLPGKSWETALTDRRFLGIRTETTDRMKNPASIRCEVDSGANRCCVTDANNGSDRLDHTRMIAEYLAGEAGADTTLVTQ